MTKLEDLLDTAKLHLSKEQMQYLQCPSSQTSLQMVRFSLNPFHFRVKLTGPLRYIIGRILKLELKEATKVTQNNNRQTVVAAASFPVKKVTSRTISADTTPR
jgi:hypothetical protein